MSEDKKLLRLLKKINLTTSRLDSAIATYKETNGDVNRTYTLIPEELATIKNEIKRKENLDDATIAKIEHTITKAKRATKLLKLKIPAKELAAFTPLLACSDEQFDSIIPIITTIQQLHQPTTKSESIAPAELKAQKEELIKHIIKLKEQTEDINFLAENIAQQIYDIIVKQCAKEKTQEDIFQYIALNISKQIKEFIKTKSAEELISDPEEAALAISKQVNLALFHITHTQPKKNAPKIVIATKKMVLSTLKEIPKMKELAENLSKEVNNFFSKSPEEQTKNLDTFKQILINYIQQAKQYLNEHSTFKTILSIILYSTMILGFFTTSPYIAAAAIVATVVTKVLDLTPPILGKAPLTAVTEKATATINAEGGSGLAAILKWLFNIDAVKNVINNPTAGLKPEDSKE